MTAGDVTLRPLRGFPLVQPGDDLAAIILERLAAQGDALADGDIVAIAQKVVSKAEGRYADLAAVTASAEAESLAAATEKDPRLIELILSESSEVLRHRPGIVIVAHRHGYVLANAGIDHSNVKQPGDGPAAPDERVLLLPSDPDTAAAALRQAFRDRAGVNVAVLINDSLGRAWRQGTCGVAIGCAGLPALLDRRGAPDLFGRPLQVTQVGLADEIAAAASLVMGQADEGQPVVIVRGVAWAGGRHGEGRAADLVRPKEQDMFR